MQKLWYCKYTVTLHILIDRGAYHNPKKTKVAVTARGIFRRMKRRGVVCFGAGYVGYKVQSLITVI